MINSEELFNSLEGCDSPKVTCDDIHKEFETHYGINNVSDLPDRIILYINSSVNKKDLNILSKGGLQEILEESEWSWLIRDVFVLDHRNNATYPVIDVVTENGKISVVYDTEIAEE